MGQGIACGIDEGVYPGSGDLVVGAAYFEIEWGNGIVGGCDIGVEIRLCDVFSEDLSLLLYRSVLV